MERDLQLLRSSPLVSNELMNLTLGDDELLTEETVTEILERVTDEIKKAEADRADQLEIERSNAQQALAEESGRSEQLERERLIAAQALKEQSERSDQLERERSHHPGSSRHSESPEQQDHLQHILGLSEKG